MNITLTNLECYTGWHLFHTFWAILSILLFVGIAIVAAMNLYEPRTSSKSFFARSNSFGEVSLLIAKIVLQLFFDILSDQWLLIIIMTGCAVLLFANQVLNRAYYHKAISKLIVRWNLLFCWSVCNVLVLKSIESVKFSGGFVIWIIGLPFVIILGAGIVQLDNELVPEPGSKSLKTSSVQGVMRSILFIFSRQREKPELFEELTTFVQNHIEVCNESDCPLKALKKEGQDFINPMTSQPQIVEVMERMFLAVLKKENSIRMRIDYAIFLLDYVGAKKRAIDELMLAQSYGPDFGQQFLIYRSQKLIEEGSVEGKSGKETKGEVDVVGMIALESHSKIIVNSIRYLSELNQRFWVHLLEEEPQLQEIYAIGVDINSVSHKAQKNWSKLGALSGQNSLIDKLYSKFLANIMKNKAEAQAIMDQFETKIQSLIAGNESDFSELKETKTQIPVCVSQFSKKYNGQLRKANQNFIIMFGVYNKEPNSMSIHNLLSDVYCQSEKKPQKIWITRLQKYTEYLGSKRQYHLKTVDGFTFQALCTSLQFSPSSIQSAELVFLSKFKSNSDTASSAQIISGKFGEILNVNTLCQVYFDLSPTKILHTAPNLSQYFKHALTGEQYRRGKVTEGYSKSPDETAWFDVSVESLMSKILALEDDNRYMFNEDLKLIGFTTCATKTIEKQMNKEMLRRFVHNSMFESPIKDNSIWDRIDQQYSCPKNQENRHSSEITLLRKYASMKLKMPIDNEFKPQRPSKDETKVVTKRLYKQRFIDVFAKKRFLFDENGNEVVKEIPAPTDSIFSKQLSKYYENELNRVSIIKTNIVEQIEHKLTQSSRRLVLILIATSVFIANFAIIITIYMNKSSKTQSLQNYTTTFSKGLNLMLSNAMITNAAYELKVSLSRSVSQVIPKDYQSLIGLSTFIDDFYAQALAQRFQVFDPSEIEGMAQNSFDYLTFLNLDYSLEPLSNQKELSKGAAFRQTVKERAKELPNTVAFMRANPDVEENNKDPAIDRQLRYVSNFINLLKTTNELSVLKLITMQSYLDTLFVWDDQLNREMNKFQDSVSIFGTINASLVLLGVTVFLNLCYCLFYRHWRQKTRRESVRMLGLFLDIPKSKVEAFKRHADQFYNFCKVTSQELHFELSKL